MSATAAKQREQAPKVVVRDDTDDPEWVNGRCHRLLEQLPKPQSVTVTLPETRRGANDSITVTICEGELDRESIAVSGEVRSGIADAPEDGGHIVGGVIRCDQLDRLIIVLQRARDEADKLGLRTPRPIPKVALA